MMCSEAEIGNFATLVYSVLLNVDISVENDEDFVEK
jgi:hypothetical protein